MKGMPTLAAAFAAARISSSADMVSIQMTSAPPSLRPSICSTKTSTASSSVSGPSGREEVAGRPDRAGDHHRPPGGVGDGAGILRGEAVQLAGAVLEIVQHQPTAIGAEGIGEDDVGAGIDEALVERADRVAMRLVPQLRRIARGEAHVEQVGAGRPVGEERRP